MPGGPWEVVMMDITPPLPAEEKGPNPALIILCPTTRFIVCRFLRGQRPITLLTIFIAIWVGLLGLPRLILTDQGTPFQGECWRQMAETHGVMVPSVPKESPNQIGAVETNASSQDGIRGNSQINTTNLAQCVGIKSGMRCTQLCTDFKARIFPAISNY